MFKRQWSDKEIDHPHALDAYPGAFKNELKRAYVEIERLQGLVNERDVQLAVCVEALKKAIDWSEGVESDTISMSEYSSWNDWMKEATEALEKVGVV